jgi:hypothetical protein
MIDNSTQNKLDGFIKESLKDIEVPLDMSGWAKMEQRLDAAPRSSSFSSNKIILGSIAASVVIIGSILAYSFWPSSSENLNPEPTVQEETAPVITHESTEASSSASIQDKKNSPESSESSVPVTTEKEQAPVIKEEKVADEKIESSEKESIANKEEKITDKNTNEEKALKENENEEKENFINIFDKLKKDQAPSFGDQIVPGKGFVKTTEEDERLRREAEKKVRENSLIKTDSIHPFGSDTLK